MAFPLYLDEDVDVDLATLLRRDGYDVLTTLEAELANRSTSDEEQLDYATREGRAFFTHNVKDFVPLSQQWGA